MRNLILCCMLWQSYAMHAQMDSISQWSTTMLEGATATIRLQAGERMQARILSQMDSMGVPATLSALAEHPVLVSISPNGKLALISLAIPQTEGHYAFRGIAAWQHNKTWYNKATQGQSSTMEGLSHDGRYRCADYNMGMTYDIVQVKRSGITHYLALVFQPSMNPMQAQRKIVEPVILSKHGPHFGSPVFALDSFNDQVFDRPATRLILQYATGVSASIKQIKPGKILIDQLAPMRHGQVGDYRRYGPTLAQAPLEFNRGKWRLAS
ncbi:MAG: hypothetical protein MUP89_03470 [Schleiferiaceae bacterium]|jgi:hypothetical protein|nr:hypothetical protein [Flavobacteriales bacterium]MDO7583688.1 hypothetical protein [Schleiferiaceae bacterium]MBT3740293.1 hypothetical protein [Flavobacteriales bacterium]MBT5023818.1 hypothetical protein [Flavobacteriales bacterium]MBT6816151.1 hypothetical protein [Flavobacteriales bacterium]